MKTDDTEVLYQETKSSSICLSHERKKAARKWGKLRIFSWNLRKSTAILYHKFLISSKQILEKINLLF